MITPPSYGIFRLDALGPLLDGELRRGDKNTVLLTDSGLAILDRVNQLQQSAGLGLSDAAGQEDGALVRALEDRIKEQAGVIEFLQGQLEAAQGQVRAMLPAVSEGRQRIGRLAGLRIAVFGK